MDGLRVRVRGQVQGVGFRPYIWALAQQYGLSGRVLNDSEGVLIEVFGTRAEAFCAAIPRSLPNLARVDGVEVATFDGPAPAGFTIALSEGHGTETRVTPDAAICPDCAAEIRAPGRRQGYGFTNCTHCGPRFTILHGLPYDRDQTTMAAFVMCPACRAEYDNPADRRFHAQPVACPDCGPRFWYEAGGAELAAGPIGQTAARLPNGGFELAACPIARGAAWLPNRGVELAAGSIAEAVALLRQGGVLAVKGLGGFHLACDAANPQALALLRLRKQRAGKPFALMGVKAALEGVANLSAADLVLLADPAAPIVLVASFHVLPDGVAPGIATLGVMLPYTPLHHLLLDAFGGILVMTSGNLSGAPQVISNDEARAKLSPLADGFLMHNRDIARRLDDGVERASPPMTLRRARGRVPGTLPLPQGFPTGQVLALGGQTKAAICLVKNGQAMLSHHLGDLDDALTEAEFHRALADCSTLFDHRPKAVACDLHDGYRSTLAARAMGLPVIAVQHHHAHLAACLGENLWPLHGGKVAGIILDGLGLGDDGTLWGGEVLLGCYAGFTRLAHLRPAPLPGGDAAGRQPWRNALMRLDQAGLGYLSDRLFADLPRQTLRAAARLGVNAPLSSSAGRLFDAVAACLGIAPHAQSYEGEAAMRLEAIAGPKAEGYPFGVGLDPAPMFCALAADLARGTRPATISARFHDGLAAAFAAPARAAVERGQAQAVALSGGCFQNLRLLDAVLHHLRGLPVLTHRQIPANDGGLAFGQALVALGRMPA